MGIVISPCKANAPLLVNTYRILVFSVSTKSVETVSGVHHQIFKACGGVQNPEPLARLTLKGLKTANPFIVEELLGVLAGK